MKKTDKTWADYCRYAGIRQIRGCAIGAYTSAGYVLISAREGFVLRDQTGEQIVVRLGYWFPIS